MMERDRNMNILKDLLYLKIAMYGRAKDLAKSTSLVKLKSDDGSQYVVNAIHKGGPLLGLSEGFNDINVLISTCRHS